MVRGRGSLLSDAEWLYRLADLDIAVNDAVRVAGVDAEQQLVEEGAHFARLQAHVPLVPAVHVLLEVQVQELKHEVQVAAIRHKDVLESHNCAGRQRVCEGPVVQPPCARTVLVPDLLEHTDFSEGCSWDSISPCVPSDLDGLGQDTP